MRFTILFIACLALHASASSLRSSEVNTILAQVDSNPLGGALLSTIHLQMKTGAPLDEIVDLLQVIRDDLNDKQAAADDLHALHEKECEDNLASFAQAVEEANQAIDYNENLIATSQAELARTETEIANAQNLIEQYAGEIQSEHDTRAAQKELFETYDFEFGDAVAAIDECIEIISELLDEETAPALVQTQMHALSQRMSTAMSKKQHSLYGNTIASLVELTTGADQDSVQQIIDLLERLKAEFSVAQNQDQDTEAERQSSYEKRVADLEAAKLAQEEYLAQQQDKKASLEATIAQAEADLAAAKDKKKENEDLIALWTDKCEERRQKYFRETDERAAEQDVIDQVEAIVNDRILSMDGYLEDRVNV